MGLIYLIFLLIYYNLDAFHDADVIHGRGNVTNKKRENRWHITDTIIKSLVSFAVFLMLFIIYNDFVFTRFLYSITIAMLFSATLRAWYFNLFLNLYRPNVKLLHLGEMGVEGWFKNKKLGLFYWLLCFGLSILLFFLF